MSLPIPMDDACWLADLKDMRHFARPCPEPHLAGPIQLDRSCWLDLLPQLLRPLLVTGLVPARASLTPRLAEASASQSLPSQLNRPGFGQQPAAQFQQLKESDDRPTIGLLLCRTQKRLVAEDALSGIDKPMGMAGYQRVRALPEPRDTSLPSIETLESELSASLEEDEP
jgi:hypothetical protein